MGKYDKDRFLKEMALRFCLTRGFLPFLEVIVSNTTSLSDNFEALTDIDVLGIATTGDGSLQRTVFDCKTTNKMSAINRAFWAAGLLNYANCDDAYVILKSRSVQNHRISALSISVDLHDEASFTELARSFDLDFMDDRFYQSSIGRWNSAHESYVKNTWSESLYSFARNVAPLTTTPWSVFRKMVAELRSAKGLFDPAKDQHVAIYLDLLCSLFLLWTTMGRDIRRLYEPKMGKDEFEKIFRYYIWGGNEAYQIRKQLREKLAGTPDASGSYDFPEWKMLVNFVGIILGAPHDIFICAGVCRELSLRFSSGPSEKFDAALAETLKVNKRARQFILALSDYLIAASALPKDMHKRVESVLLR